MLRLKNCEFSPGATEDVQQLTTLQSLYLQDSNLDDELIVPLCKMPNLEKMNISGTQVSDVGLLRLAVLPKLKDLKCGAVPGITVAGKDHFRKVRPDVKLID